MANRAQRRRQMKTTELREQAIEALGQTPYIDIETDDGQTFRVWHPLLTDDDAQTRIHIHNNGGDLDHDDEGNIIQPPKVKGKLADPDIIRSARAILGPAVHKEFVKAGGHSRDVELAWTVMTMELEGTALADDAEDEDPK